MKSVKLFVAFLLFATLMCPIVALPSASVASSSSNEEKAMLFISTVLPYDVSKSSVTLTNVIEKPVSKGNAYDKETFKYTLKADENTAIVMDVTFNNNVLSSCSIDSPTGSLFKGSNESVIDSARSFLQKYQTFTKEDLSDMLNALSKAGNTKNVTTTSGNINLDISTNSIGSRVITAFRWAVAINGVEYSSMTVEYHNGDLYAFFDNRGISKIGNTDVNVSEEQAVELALKYIKTYSYRTMGGSRDDPYFVDVTDFNVNMSRISCKLIPYSGESSLLGPCWSVQLPLEGDYGNIWALSVFVGAGSGEIFECRPFGTGGASFNPEDTQNSSMWIICVAVIVVAVAVVALLLITKKYKKR